MADPTDQDIIVFVNNCSSHTTNIRGTLIKMEALKAQFAEYQSFITDDNTGKSYIFAADVDTLIDMMTDLISLASEDTSAIVNANYRSVLGKFEQV